MSRIVEFTRGDENLIVDRILDRIERELEKSSSGISLKKPKKKDGFAEEEKTTLLGQDTGPSLTPSSPPIPFDKVPKDSKTLPPEADGSDYQADLSRDLSMLEDRTGLNAVRNNTRREIIVLSLALLFLVAGTAYYFFVVRPDQIP